MFNGIASAACVHRPRARAACGAVPPTRRGARQDTFKGHCNRSSPGAVFVQPLGALTYHGKCLNVAAYLPRAQSRLVMRALTIASSDRDHCAFTNPLRTVAQAHR